MSENVSQPTLGINIAAQIEQKFAGRRQRVMHGGQLCSKCYSAPPAKSQKYCGKCHSMAVMASRIRLRAANKAQGGVDASAPR